MHSVDGQNNLKANIASITCQVINRKKHWLNKTQIYTDIFMEED